MSSIGSKPGVVRLVDYVFDDRHDDMADELAAWVARSPRFRTFVETHRDKIRKKLRGAIDAETRRDVRTELRVAGALLGDRAIELEYEAYGSGKLGPDFAVRYRADRVNLEVTRLRGAANDATLGGQLLAKLRQLPPSVPNALLIAVDAGGPGDAATGDVTAAASAGDGGDVGTAVLGLRNRADRKDDEFFASRGLGGSRSFYDRFLRLGAVLVWNEKAAGGARVSLWTNRSARIPLPPRTLRAIVRALETELPET